MLKTCKSCKNEVDFAENMTANMRCNKCGSYEHSFDGDVIAECFYCKEKTHVIEGRFNHFKNKCYQSMGMTQVALWVLKQVTKPKRSSLEEINIEREKLNKPKILRSKKAKESSKKRVRPKKTKKV